MKCKFFGECENIVPQSKCCTNEQTVALSNALQTKSRFSFSYFRLILSKNTRIFIKKKKFFRSACNARTSINQPPAEVCAAADAIAATTTNLLRNDAEPGGYGCMLCQPPNRTRPPCLSAAMRVARIKKDQTSRVIMLGC